MGFDKLIRKEKKKMDKKYAKNNDYLKLNLDDNLYNRLNLNDTDFFMSVKGFLINIQKNPVNDDADDDNADDANDDNADNTVDNNDDDANDDNADDANDDKADNTKDNKADAANDDNA